MNQDQELRYKRQIENAKKYTNLFLNTDFQAFKEEQFDIPMARLVELVMDGDLKNMQEIHDNILKYQTLSKAYIESFSTKIDTATKAREMLNNRKPKEMQ